MGREPKADMLDYDSLAEEYGRHRGVHPGVLHELVFTAGLDGSSRVLEVGCGTANYLVAAHTAIGCRCSGIDPSEQMLMQARDRGLPLVTGRGRAEELQFPDESFDLVFSVDVIHHVVDRERYHREAHRVLATGGRLCTATDSEDIIRARQPLATYFPETVPIELARYAGIDSLREMMALAGFNAIGATRVEHAFSTTDIQAFRDKAFSCLHLIPKDAFERGIRRMEDDLRKGPIPCVSQYVMLWGTK
jgi:ubiquinone/menaquinone biosynthesis C-methylase UbiE